MLKNKILKLENIISDNDRVAIAYSGGIDSTLLLKIANNIKKKMRLL